MHATYSQAEFDVISPSPFRAFFDVTRPMSAEGAHHDRFGSRHSDLRHAGAWPDGGRRRGQGVQARRIGRFGVKLEAQIKSEAGPVAKSSATLRNDADAAFRRSDFRVGLQILGQIAATTPEDSANWLKLAKTIFQIRSASSSEQTFLYERASTAAYIAYQRAGNQAEEADALAVLGRAMSERKLWRPALDSLRLSLDLREVAEVRGQYEKMRDQHGFRLLDYTVDSDGASPRACFQFSEDLAKRVDFAPFLALAGTDKPALTTEGKQLCVDGLKHGERYNVNLRAGLPSTVKEIAAEIGRVQHLCARPQAVRALHRPRLCAAAHRPARHPAGQRQYAGGERQRVPDRRPQFDQHGGRQRFPEDAVAATSSRASATSAASRSGPANLRPRPR